MTDIFICFHKEIRYYVNSANYLKLNNNITCSYDYSNIIIQPSEYQWSQPSFSEFTGFKMIQDMNLFKSDWLATFQYDHKITEEDIEFINSNDEIIIFNPFGEGTSSIRNQNYTIGSYNFVDFILLRYNQYFGTNFTEEQISEIPFPVCSSAKLNKFQFNKIMNFIFSHEKSDLLFMGSNISYTDRWIAHLFERMFGISIMFEILNGEKFKIKLINHIQ